MFLLCFQKADKGPGMLFCLHLAACALSPLKADPHSDIKGQLSGAGRKISPLPALCVPSNYRALRVVAFIASCVNMVTQKKTPTNSPTPWFSICPDPLPHT